MSDSLVDSDDYPRNDIDVFKVREARHEIICLQNDLKELMTKIDSGLEMYFADMSLQQSTGTTNANKIPPETQIGESSSSSISNGPQLVEAGATTQQEPFAKVTFINENSPASTAGFKVDDELLEFGTLKRDNFKELTQVAEIVKHRENSSISVKIRRDRNRIYSISLVPKKWSGRGLLGCNIVAV